jgi:hypothetical protein
MMKQRWQIFWHAFFWVFILLFCLAIARNNSVLPQLPGDDPQVPG